MFLNLINKDKPCSSLLPRPQSGAFFIEGQRGRLFSLLYTPQGSGPHPAVLLLHGFPGNEQNLDLAQMLRRVGFCVLTMHYSGSWGSDGLFSFTNVLDDARVDFRFLSNENIQNQYQIDPENLFVIGHSMGAFAALHVIAEEPCVKAGVAIAPYDFGQMAISAENDTTTSKNLMDLLEEGAPWLAGATSTDLRLELDEHAERFSLHRYATPLSLKPLLIIAGRLDECALPSIHCDPLVNVLKEKGKGLLEYVVFDSDHCFSDLRISLGEKIASWLVPKV